MRDEEHSTNALERLRRANAWVFDMDGVLYRGAEPLPGVSELLDVIERRGSHYMLATNNSMSTASQYVDKLAAMSVRVDEAVILTSAMATRDYILQELGETASLLIVGMPALEQQLLRDTRFRKITSPDDVPDAIVVGLDKHFTYDKLAAANAAIRGGARFVATNTDATLPTETGLVPGAGSIVAAIQTASGVAPIVIGKPEPLMLQMALAGIGVSAEDAVMIGDRLDTDIAAGYRAGMLTVLVLTGVSRREEIASAAPLPDLVFTDLNALLEALTVDA